MENINKEIDQLLQIRQDGILAYAKATRKLIDLGVKIGDNRTGSLRIPSTFSNYIDNFNKSNLEFEWEVEYTDGVILKQFSDKEHNFSHIDQSRIKQVRFVSNFNWPTGNEEKRVIVGLNWDTGVFTFVNGFLSQDDRAKLYKKECRDNKKLIMFCRKRFSSTVGDVDPTYTEFAPSTDEFFHYNRFVLGYEVPGTEEKIMVMVYPTGYITIFE